VDPGHFGTDPKPHLWLTDPDSNPDPTIIVAGIYNRVGKDNHKLAMQIANGFGAYGIVPESNAKREKIKFLNTNLRLT
jgi:hypothetical protein